MKLMLISLGQTASHEPVTVQLPKPSASICSTIANARLSFSGLHRDRLVRGGLPEGHQPEFHRADESRLSRRFGADQVAAWRAAICFCLRITINIAQPPMMPKLAIDGYQAAQPYFFKSQPVKGSVIAAP